MSIQNVAWLYGEKLFRLAISFFVGIIVARYLGPENYGYLAFAVAYFSLFMPIASLGFESTVARDLVRNPEKATTIIHTAIITRIIVGLTMWLLCVAGFSFFGSTNKEQALVAILGLGLIVQAADVVDYWFISQSVPRKGAMIRAAVSTFSAGLKLIAVYHEADVLVFAAIQLLDVTIAAGIMLIIYRLRPVRHNGGFSWSVATSMVRESIYYSIAGLAVVIYMRLDQVFLRSFVGPQELGFYAIIIPVTEACNYFAVSVCSVMAPSITRWKMESEEKYRHGLLLLFGWLQIAAILISILISVSAEWLIEITFGPAYAKSAALLQLYIFTIVPVYLGIVQTQWIINEKRQRLMLIKALSGAFISIGLNLLLIPKYGAYGAVISALVSYFVSAVLFNLLCCRDIFFMQLTSSVSVLRGVKSAQSISKY